MTLDRAERALGSLDGSTGTIVLVEGESDAVAVATLAARFGADVGLDVVSAYGVTNYRKLIVRIRAEQPGRRVVGLYDEPEEHVVRRALTASGLGRPVSRADIERLGFFACVVDLEDELIRAIGVDRAERLVEEQDELPAFRIMQKQPAQRDRPVAQQLRRFLGTKSTRKIRYGNVLAAAVELDRCPDPLVSVIRSSRSGAAT